MSITGEHILIAEHGRRHGLPLGVVDLGDRRRRPAHKLRIVEFMAPILPAVKREAPVAERESAVRLAGGDGIGQYAAHGIFPGIGDDLLAEIHHTATLGLDASALFSEVLDGSSAGFIGHECLQMLLGIAAGQVKQVDVVEARRIRLGIEEARLSEKIQCLLIEEGKGLGTACNKGSDFAPGKVRLCSRESPSLLRGNSQFA